MIKDIKRKLSSNAGESIAEVLVAALIVVLGSLLLHTMVNASFRLLTKEEESYKEFIDERNEFEIDPAAESRFGEDPFTMTIQSNAGGTYTRQVILYVKKVGDVDFYRYELKD